MTKWATLVILVLAGTACLPLSLANGDVAEPTGEEATQSRILKQRDCFGGSFSDYDVWIGKLHSLKMNGNRATYETRFPRDDFEEYKQTLECRFFIYNVNGLLVEGYYVKPKDFDGDRLPVIIYNRGGNGRYGKMNFGGLFLKTFPLASSGFILVGSQYRGSGIWGIEGDNGEDEFGGNDVEDVLALFDIVDQMPDADRDRIGMAGWSRGGFMTFIAATRTDRLLAIAVGGTPTHFEKELESRPEMERVFRARIPDYDNNKDVELMARSAQLWPEKIPPELPVLVLHGEQDQKVTLDSATEMVRRLQDNNHPHKLVIYDDGSHTLFEHSEEVLHELVSWFEMYLID